MSVQDLAQAGPVMRAIKEDRTDYSGWQWRGTDSDVTLLAANGNCPTGTACWIYPQGTLRPTENVTDDAPRALQTLDLGQRALEVFGSAMTLGLINVPEIRLQVPKNDCDDDGGGACAFSEHDVGVSLSRTAWGDTITHELGHILQRRLMHVALNNGGANYGTDGTWTFISEEMETIATHEGFAAYVGAASWYDPDVPNDANYKDVAMDKPNAAPIDTSSCATYGNNSNGHRAEMIMRAFWDLDDANNEAAVSPATSADTQNWTSLDIATRWGHLDLSSGNGGVLEPPPNGRNLWDFVWAPGSPAGANSLTHNCIQQVYGY